MDTKNIRESQKQWEDGVLRESLERDGEWREKFEIAEGMIAVNRVYTPLDMEERGIDFIKDIGYPGEFPYTRGIEPLMYRKKPWEMSQYSGFGSAAESNKRYKDLIGRGLTGLYIAQDLPSQIGYDSDHPLAHREVGKIGVAIDSLEDVETMLEGIPLEKLTSLRTTANATGPIWIALMLALTEKQGVKPNDFKFVIQNDVLREFAGRGTQIFPIKPSLKFTTDALEFCARNLKTWSPVQVSGEHMRGMGARNIEGLAFTLADGIQYLDSTIARGVDVDDVAPTFEFLLSAWMNLLEEVAKFRAARKLWATFLKERYGAKNPESFKMKVCAFGAGSPLTRQEPINNIVRITVECLALALGGVYPAINLPSYDEAAQVPAEEAARIALRTQQIIAYETGIVDTVDPLAGSYYVESLVNEIERKVIAIIEEIDKLGGAANAIEEGYYDRLINYGAHKYQKEIDSGERIIVGVNKFRLEEEVPIKAFRGSNPEEEAKQVARVKDLRRRRDNRAVTEKLRALTEAAKKDENLVLPILDAVKEYATIGEICDTLREIWGAWEARPTSMSKAC